MSRYCAAYSTSGTVIYLCRRVNPDDSSTYRTIYVQYASVGTAEKVEKYRSSLIAKYPAFEEDFARFQIRKLTNKEEKEYDEETTKHKAYLDRRSRQCLIRIVVDDDGVLTMYTKGNPNKADHAFISLMQKAVFQLPGAPSPGAPSQIFTLKGGGYAVGVKR